MLTPLQRFLLGFYALLERGRDELTAEEFRAFVFILTNSIGEEAGRLVIGEAIEATEAAA